MYKLANGWTKEKVMAQIKKFNDGTRTTNKITGGCAYKDQNGNRCAIGAFIPYKSGKALNFEGNVVELLVSFPKLKKYMPFDDEKALMSLQVRHDTPRTDNTYHHDIYHQDVHASIADFLKNEVE